MAAVSGAEMGLTMRAAIQAMRETEAEPVWMCPECRDIGMVVRTREDGSQFATGCACGVERAARRRLARTGIPPRYAEASFDTLRTAGMDPSIGLAARLARSMAEGYLPGAGTRGMLLHGTCGTGKTHLAISILRYLVLQRGCAGRFWDLGDLLAAMKRSYGPDGAVSEGALLDQVAGVDVLVLDELGAQRLTDWAMESVSLLLNARYNGMGLTVLTTNYPNLPAGAGTGGAETLGDRIGTRMWSRLQEMCAPVAMVGADYRVRKAAR